MPDPVRLLKTLEGAVRAFRETPGRTGRMVALQDVNEVLATGDLHGQMEYLRLIVKRADLAKNPRRHLVLQEVVHGPLRYPDGSDKSHQALDVVAALKHQFPRQVHFLPGNHELAQWQGHRIGKAGIDQLSLFHQGIVAAYGSHADAIWGVYAQLIAAAPLALRTPNRVFLSHSLPEAVLLPTFDLTTLLREEIDPAAYRLGGLVHSLVWGRDTRTETVEAFLKLVDADLLISGHIPSDAGYATPNAQQLILDTSGSPAAICLFPTTRPLTQAELVSGIEFL